ncbi:hypothetical protein CHS0354_036350 [Potamilus streckersoni]|uniref:Uncharacterized protein n=1 Tax=Potamilus streckersoni TaxID=2493646 RepID=A0AAE0SRX5_9BIVA|nr:hypothetical protein CHS0354_036350 [Potamilus streckersoni]
MAVGQNAVVFILGLTLISGTFAIPAVWNGKKGLDLKPNLDQGQNNEAASSYESRFLGDTNGLTMATVPSALKNMEATIPESIYVRTQTGRLLPVSYLIKSQEKPDERHSPNIKVIKRTVVVTEVVHGRDNQNAGKSVSDIQPGTGNNRQRGIFNRVGFGNGLYYPQPNFLLPPQYNLDLNHGVLLSGQMQNIGEAGALKADLRGTATSGIKIATLASNGAELNRIFLLPSNPVKKPIVVQTSGPVNVSQQQTQNGKTKLVIRPQPDINGNGNDASQPPTNGNQNDASPNSANGNGKEAFHYYDLKREDVEEV